MTALSVGFDCAAGAPPSSKGPCPQKPEFSGFVRMTKGQLDINLFFRHKSLSPWEKVDGQIAGHALGRHLFRVRSVSDLEKQFSPRKLRRLSRSTQGSK